MVNSATIKLHLPHGDPQQLGIAEISNWNGKALYAPRTSFSELLIREELIQPGIYVLQGSNENGEPLAYIGEGESLNNRLPIHKGRDFWNKIIVFVSKDENLTKAHIKYLEGKLLEETKDAGRFKLDNYVKSNSKLPESDKADMEVFISKIRQLLPILGCNILIPIKDISPNSTPLFYCKNKGRTAQGKRTANGFVVLKNSQTIKELRPAAKLAIRNIFSSLIEENIISLESEEGYIFTKDYEFKSPSTAASLVCGGSENGLIAWKNKDGKTLKEIEELD